MRRSSIECAASAAAILLSLPVIGQATFMNFEGKLTRPIFLSVDGGRLVAVNTADARLSVFDVSAPANPILVTEIPVGMEPGLVNMRTADEAWVVNELSDSVSIVSLSRGVVIDTLRVGDEPSDVVFAGGRPFVSAARANRIDVFDATTRTSLGSIALQGENPRALAVSTDGATVYAAFALSGNRTTLIPLDLAPPQPPPNLITNEAPQVGLIVDAEDTNWTSVTAATKTDTNVVATCALLESQAAASNINLVVKGRMGGRHVSLLFEPGTGLYTTDRTGTGPYTRTQLLAQLTGDAVVTAMGVPPGAGVRMAHDRDEDGIADGDVVPPALDLVAEGMVVSWPGSDSWYVLEETSELGTGTWSTVTEERSIENGHVVVTNDAPDSARTYRLRRPW